MSREAVSPPWTEGLYDVLKEAGISQFCYVPDAGHQVLIHSAANDPDVRAILLTTEEEGVALVAGAHLGLRRGVLLMQSSGVGNCINMLSLIKTANFPFLCLVTMRGDFGEQNPWQYPMGQATPDVLKAMGVICLRADEPAELLSTVRAATSMTFSAGKSVAVLIGQKIIGAKQF